jgi:hypothetical protein
VCARVRELVLSLEAEREGQCIVLTSHADTLQITQCYVAGADPRSFSMYRFKNGRGSTLERLVPPVAERATDGVGRPSACTRRPSGLQSRAAALGPAVQPWSLAAKSADLAAFDHPGEVRELLRAPSSLPAPVPLTYA